MRITVTDLERGHHVIEHLPCDVLITTHPVASSFWERVERDGLVDPDACRRYAASARRQLRDRLQREADDASDHN